VNRNGCDTRGALDPETCHRRVVESVGGRARRGRQATRRLAERYRLEFLDMHEFRIDQELFRSIPAD
jgi:hypothetical protein